MLIQHLLATYGRITKHALNTNDVAFKQPMDPGQPFETFITQIEDTTEYAAAGNTPYMAPQLIGDTYTLVYNTSIFPGACCEGRRRPAQEKIWANFKTHFAETYHDYCLTKNTTQGAGYHTANNVMNNFVSDTPNAFVNLATATASNRSMMAKLTNTNSGELLQQLATQAAELQTLRSQL
jgi:hypothetical protein